MSSLQIKRAMFGEVCESVKIFAKEGRLLSALFCILWFAFSHFEDDDIDEGLM